MGARGRLLILSDRFPPHDRGGSERIAHLHALGLRRRGWDVAVFTSFPPIRGAVSTIADEDGLRVFRSFPLHPLSAEEEPTTSDKALELSLELWNPWMGAPLRRAITEFRPDVIHAHYIPRISFGAFAAAAPGVPRVLTFHGYNFECPKGGLYRKRGIICTAKPIPCRIYQQAMTRSLERVDRMIAIARFIEHRLLESGAARERVRWLPNPVPLDAVSAPPASKSATVLFVGRLERLKGIDVLLRAFRSLAMPDARLRIIGAGSDLERLRALAAGDSRIDFPGWLRRDEVVEAYRGSRVVVVPSLWHEVMNTVICEAASYGRPAIATDLGGNPDLVSDGTSGFLIPAGDADAIRDRLARLLTDDALADAMGEAARAHVASFDYDRHLDAIEDLYEEILGASAEGSGARRA
ncbi:MAG: glycosyltransferase family 4 protein [Candidatus Binatia bacterium]